MRIGDLADRFGLNPRTVRYYEDIGVIPEPHRTPAGQRIYGEADAERIDFVRSAQRLGFTLDEIREIMTLRDRDERPCGYVVTVLDKRLEDLAARIAEMRTLRATLQDLRSRATERSADGSRYCQIIEHVPRRGT
jgi:DNA-binding transcriptional MerR regulator